MAHNLNLLGPMLQMSSAAWGQGIEIGKQKLREFLESNDTARQAIGMPGRESSSRSSGGSGESIGMDTLDSRGRRSDSAGDDDI